MIITRTIASTTFPAFSAYSDQAKPGVTIYLIEGRQFLDWKDDETPQPNEPWKTVFYNVRVSYADGGMQDDYSTEFDTALKIYHNVLIEESTAIQHNDTSWRNE